MQYENYRLCFMEFRINLVQFYLNFSIEINIFNKTKAYFLHNHAILCVYFFNCFNPDEHVSTFDGHGDGRKSYGLVL